MFVWAVVKLHSFQGFVIVSEFRILFEDVFHILDDFPILQLFVINDGCDYY